MTLDDYLSAPGLPDLLGGVPEAEQPDVLARLIVDFELRQESAIRRLFPVERLDADVELPPLPAIPVDGTPVTVRMQPRALPFRIVPVELPEP